MVISGKMTTFAAIIFTIILKNVTTPMKKNHLIMSTLLFCGLGMFTACSDVKDNPATNPTTEPVTSAERKVFEEQFSKDMQAMADGFRFEAAMKTTTSLKEFIDVLDENALATQVTSILGQMIGGLSATTLDTFDEKEKAHVISLLKSRFGITDDDMKDMQGIMIVDAYNSIGKMKLEFKDGQCNITNDADAFTIVSTNSNGETKTVALKFNDERDGVRFFVTRLASIPICVQLPQSIGVTMTTADGEIVNGTVNLTTIDENQSKFISFKESGWLADVKLTANVNNRQESMTVYAKHTEQRAFDLKAAFEIQGKEMARVEFTDMHDQYTDEEIDSEEFKSMREMGPFFAGAYDLLKALKGKSVDNVAITINDNLVVNGKVDDIAKSLLALGNVRKLHGSQPGKETIDQYTQQLNGLVHFTFSQKNTGITAQGTLVTAQKELQDGEYQPAVALQFSDETEPLVLLDRMTATDMANYKTMMGSFQPLVTEMSELLISARKKGEAVLSSVKSTFGM